MFFLIFLVANLATKVSSSNTCPNCGEMEVPYPLSTSESCGDSNYRIYCNNNLLQFLSSKGIFYKIQSIDPTSYQLIISPPPMINQNTCYTSDINVGGLELDENLPFNISSHNTVMLFNCSADILKSPLNCSSTSLCRRFEAHGEGGRGCRGTLCCHFLKDASMNSHKIRVRSGGCSAYTCVVNMNDQVDVHQWRYGIELQWMPPK
ncbi:Protein kinase superfamily protein [Euphorbia peplus]|nr:Protein kinase superfamily protein [Euphorbia peplus]